MTRTALVTGAAGGIGGATVAAFAAAGWDAIAVDRRPAEGLPDGVEFLRADVGAPAEVEEVAARLQAGLDRLDALVNNAALQVSKPLVELTAGEWDSMMAANLRAAYLMVKALHPLLQAAKGSIVNVSSVHAIATSAGLSGYAATKGGLLALTRSMALEFAADGIRANAVLPGAVDTPMLRAGLDRGHVGGGSRDDQLAALAAKTPLGRVGTPQEIASAIRFLADGDESGFMTGAALVVDGGATARLSTE